MKTLFTNGCSWTAGGGLDLVYNSLDEEFSKMLWPYHLKNAMGFDRVVNYATGCGSNQRIVRTTLDWILAQDAETLKNTTVVIQFTEWSRFEYYYPINTTDPFENVSHRWALCSIGHAYLPGPGDTAGPITSDSIPDLNQRTSLSRYRTYTEIEAVYRLASQCAALVNFFDTYGIKEYYFWSFVLLLEGLPDPIKTHLLSKYNWLEKGGRHLWEYERISKFDPHPSELGHVQLAECIHQSIQTFGEQKWKI